MVFPESAPLLTPYMEGHVLMFVVIFPKRGDVGVVHHPDCLGCRLGVPVANPTMLFRPHVN